MSMPWRARYGDCNGRHDLVEWNGPGELPSILLGLTDKPPGHLGPGERWWPSVGCGPVGEWWALWWTTPDRMARRGGMVHSEVALWTMADIRAVPELRPTLSILSGGAPFEPPSPTYLGAVAEALLAEGTDPPIIPSLDAWPGVLCAIWAKLWPTARGRFSARVALAPPQGGESIAPPWLFATPASKAPQWPHSRVISSESSLDASSRPARWMMGQGDPTMEEILGSGLDLDGDLRILRGMARAADRLDRLRDDPGASDALSTLRTLILVAPSKDAATLLKQETLRHLVEGLAKASIEVLAGLCSVSVEALLDASSLADGLERWIHEHVAELELEAVEVILTRLAPGRAMPWWTNAVTSALSRALERPNPSWSRAVIGWLTRPACSAILERLLPSSMDVEDRLLAAAMQLHFDLAAARPLLAESTRRGWSRLHACVVLAAHPARRAIQMQRKWAGTANLGLPLLVERAPGPDVVHEAIEAPDREYLRLAAQRTARDPALLELLDAHQPAWRALWEAHVEAGGNRWPPGRDRAALADALLEAVLRDDEPARLLVMLAPDLGSAVLRFGRRRELWGKASTAVQRALVPPTVGALFAACEATIPPPPEPILIAAISDRMRTAKPSPRVVAALLTWPVVLTEDQLSEWLRLGQNRDWASVAVAVGRAIERRGWSRAARELHYRWRWDGLVRDGVAACASLLPAWMRWGLGSLGSDPLPSHDSPAPLVEQVAVLGAKLSPDDLDHQWERAGGSRERLPSTGTPESRWRAAARDAANGAIPGGLVSLIAALRKSFRHNLELEELERILRDTGIRGDERGD